MKTKKSNTKDITILGLFIALMAVLAFVPYIGFIPLTPAISLSIVHLPAIVGTIILGFKKGMILSLAFGVLSLIRAFTPMGVADVTFQNPLIAILPRLFITPGAYGVYKLMQKLFTSASRRMAKRSDSSAGFIGGLTGVLAGVIVTIVIFSSLNAGLAISPVLCALIASPFGCLAGIGLYAAAKNKFRDPERAAVSFGCAAGSLSNTIFTLLAFYFFVPIFFPELLAGDLATNSGFIKYLFGLLAINGILEMVVITAVGTPVTLAITGANRKKAVPLKEDSDAAGN
ncbi:MAG: hypothetical protein DBY09_06690 [Selenomonadales bacterium]|jgi:hypothetical protein|nr:MAG: hypothetical protein DBY09_06690 [Selenomonadales bacterium]